MPAHEGRARAYDRLKDRLREELTLAQIDPYATELEKIDVEEILAFVKRVLPRPAHLSVQASLEQRQCLQRAVFPERIRSTEKSLFESR